MQLGQKRLGCPHDSTDLGNAKPIESRFGIVLRTDFYASSL